MKDFMKMMRQAQELQGRMQKMQADLEEMEVEGQAGAGLVTVRLNGKGDVRGLRLDKSLMNAEEVEILEDLIVAAFQDAKSKVESAMQEKMQEVTGGLPLPPGMKLF
ncbi:MAG: YbaB/EbfC family nucleoid-associated protein [Hyphomicrobiaceae bacterium]